MPYKLKTLREASGLTQQQLADKAGVTLRCIQVYEAESPKTHRDINGAAALVVYKLATALGCQVHDLLEDEDASV